MQWIGTTGSRLVERPTHRHWLLGQAQDLLRLHGPTTVNTRGGFSPLALDGSILSAGSSGALRQLHDTARMVHCHAIGHAMGQPGSDALVNHGMAALWNGHRDTRHGGYVWSFDDQGAVDRAKQAYGHAFVLLAASSAKLVGHPNADRLLNDVVAVLEERFWDEAAGASREEFEHDWTPRGEYRGQNSNMHLTEALMAAYEATGDGIFLTRAERIATLLIDDHARAENWRVPEHFTVGWSVDYDYEGNPMFRPGGTTPGHALEWSRLLVQLWELGKRQHAWMLEAARALFLRTVEIGWARGTGGFYYTLDWQDQPLRSDRFWWPCAEGAGAAAVLSEVTGDAIFEEWYRRIWNTIGANFLDVCQGGWFAELDAEMRSIENVFVGKPDLYHALQACLVPLLPTKRGILTGFREGALRI